MDQVKRWFLALILTLTTSMASAQGLLSQMPQASLPLSGSELLYVVQNGQSRQAPVNAVQISGSSLAGVFASPPPIGNVAPNTIAATTLSVTSTISGAGFTNLFASPPPLGNVAASSVAATSLTASGAVSGAGFTNLFASPPPIGNVAPGTGAFTSLSANTNLSLTASTWSALGSQSPLSMTTTLTGANTSGVPQIANLQITDNSTNTSGGIAFVAGITINSPASGFKGGGYFYTNANGSGDGGSVTNVGLTGAAAVRSTLGNGTAGIFGGNLKAQVFGSSTEVAQDVGLEIDTGQTPGASIADRMGLQVVDVNQGGGTGQQATIDDVSLSLNNQYAPSSSAGYRVGFEFGRFGGAFPVATNGTLITATGNVGESVTVAGGIDFRLATFTAAFFQTQFASLDGAGTLRIGRSFLSDSSGGLIITPTGSIGVSATVSAPGTGYTNGSDVVDNYGGLWRITSLSGSGVATVSLVSAPYVSGATPSNPISLAMLQGTAGGSGATINVTWAAGTDVTVAGPLIATAYTAGASAGVSCTGSPTGSFASVNGIVTHC